MSKKEVSPESRAILDAIRNIVRALRVSSRASEKECGLSVAQIFVLQQLDQADGISLNELAERTLTHQSSVSVVVSKLCERKLVSRRPSRSDSRKVALSLTEAGRQTLKNTPRAAQEQLVAAIHAMKPAKREQLARLLSELVNEAGFASGPATMLLEEEK